MKPCLVEGKSGQTFICGDDDERQQCYCEIAESTMFDLNWCDDSDSYYTSSTPVVDVSNEGYSGQQPNSNFKLPFRYLMPEVQVKKLEESGSLHDGYLIFQSLPLSGQTNLLGLNFVEIFNNAMGSSINHVGIIRYVNGNWRVIEANADGVRYIKLVDFIKRNPNAYWIKRIISFSENSSEAQSFVSNAHGYWGRPYDYRFEEGEDNIYCSELVELAARGLHIAFGDISIPAMWLDGYDKSVKLYLAVYRKILNPEDAPIDWTIFPPHTLFYSNALTDPNNLPEGFDNRPIYSVTNPNNNNYLYDTLPGETIEAKCAYLISTWGTRLKSAKILKFKVRATESGDVFNYQFRFFTKGVDGTKTLKSLLLFGENEEEMHLATMIMKFMSDE